MSLNRVIGSGSKIPWHLPDDFKWFKQTTTGHIIVMGRKTYESIGRPLPSRTTIVLSRTPGAIPGVQVIARLEEIAALQASQPDKEVFICGGAQIYEHALPFCSDLYLTIVKWEVEGDTFFPPFENDFVLAGEVIDRPEFKITHWRRASKQRPGTALAPQG